MKNRDLEYDTDLQRDNGGLTWFTKYSSECYKDLSNGHKTLPIAAAYNAGFDEGYKKARNELCHISQTKND